MTKRRDRRPKPAPEPVHRVPASLPTRVIDIGAAVTLLLALALAWASRGNLNVDGVSYLDLADRIRAGEWGAFVQGYWSPASPLLLAAVLELSGASGSDAITVAHVLNFGVAACAIALLWRAARHRSDAAWGLLAFTALLTSSARTLRLDAVTPDLLLLALVTGFTLELLRADGWRGARLGAWAGAAFLAKTSAWPWLLVVACFGGAVVWSRHDLRRGWMRAVAIAALPVLLWTVALGARSGTPTLGSAGRLNACWYLFSCDGRTPDTHGGEHRDYHDWIVGASQTASVAVFADSGWTYAPWSDPTAWQEGVLTQARQAPTVPEFVTYVATQLGLVVGLWMAMLIGVVGVPAMLASRRAPPLREAVRTPAGLAVAFGVCGILQFVAVHAEPRLVAPFVMMVALGFLEWRWRGTATRLRASIVVAGWLVALAVGAWHLRDQLRVTASSTQRTAQLELTHPPHLAPHRVAVVGSALPMVPDLYRARAVVVAQLIRPDPAGLAAWPPAAQAAVAGRLRELGATALWISQGRSAYRIVRLEAASPVAPTRDAPPAVSD